MIDRNHIVEEFYWEELDFKPKYIPAYRYLDYENYSNLEDKRQELEGEYSYDEEKAEKIIADKMEELGAEKNNGNWENNGEPVELTLLIRDDDPNNRQGNIGNYVADKLENMGFEVEREYGDLDDQRPIYLLGDPEDGEWNIYTGGWTSNLKFIEEDRPLSVIYDDRNIIWFYSGEHHDPLHDKPLYDKYEPIFELSEYVDKIINNEWSKLEERAEILEEAWELALKDSFRIWIGELVYHYD